MACWPFQTQKWQKMAIADHFNVPNQIQRQLLNSDYAPNTIKKWSQNLIWDHLNSTKWPKWISGHFIPKNGKKWPFMVKRRLKMGWYARNH